MKTKVETITPKQAETYLDHNTINRSLNQKRVKALAKAIERDEWMLTGDPIRFDSDGRLIDGQHRLHACLVSALPIKSLVIRGLDPAVFKVIDTGKSRTAGDVLSIMGYASGARLAVAAKVYYGLAVGYPLSIINKSYNGLTNAQTIKVVEATPGLVERVRQFHSPDFRLVRCGPRAIYTAVAEATYQGVPGKAASFWEGVISGVGLQKGDPALALRDKMLRARTLDVKPQHWQWVGWIVAAWNAHLDGRKVTQLLIKGRTPQAIYGWVEPDLRFIEDPNQEAVG